MWSFQKFLNKIKCFCKLRKRRIFQICIDCLYFCLWKTWIQFTNAFILLMIIFSHFMTVFFISGHWDIMLSHSVSRFFTLVVVLLAVQDLDHTMHFHLTCYSPWALVRHTVLTNLETLSPHFLWAVLKFWVSS